MTLHAIIFLRTGLSFAQQLSAPSWERSLQRAAMREVLEQEQRATKRSRRRSPS